MEFPLVGNFYTCRSNPIEAKEYSLIIKCMNVLAQNMHILSKGFFFHQASVGLRYDPLAPE